MSTIVCKACEQPIVYGQEVHAVGLNRVAAANPNAPLDCFYHRRCCPEGHQ